jgi:hypothetical protein
VSTNGLGSLQQLHRLQAYALSGNIFLSISQVLLSIVLGLEIVVVKALPKSLSIWRVCSCNDVNGRVCSYSDVNMESVFLQGEASNKKVNR